MCDGLHTFPSNPGGSFGWTSGKGGVEWLFPGVECCEQTTLEGGSGDAGFMDSLGVRKAAH